MGKPVVHFEFWSQDPAKISEFYEKVFDWKIQSVPEMDYRLVDTGGEGINGGIMTPQKGPWPSNLTFYIDVDNIETYNQKIKDAGGNIIVERMEIPNVGAFSLFADPDGRVLGLWLQTKKD